MKTIWFQEKPFWKMDAQERITACESKKRDGNILFKAGMFHLASKKYEKECNLRKKQLILQKKIIDNWR